jgi:hypothetical protein
MSEKRRRNQQRRQRRKAQGEARSRSREQSPDQMLAEVAELVANAVGEVTDALDAEQWASGLIATWRHEAPPGELVDPVLFPKFARALETLDSGPALAALRALDAVGAPAAGEAATRLAATGVPEPVWAGDLGQARPTAAALLSEAAFDDGVSVLVEFAEPGGEFHTLGAYIDHNVGGLVKDVFLAGRLDEVRATMESAPDRDRITFAELDLAEARARIEAALDVLDHTLDPPVSDEVHSLRALLGARMDTLPGGHQLPDPYVELSLEERDALLEDFLASDEGRRWRADDEAAYAARLAIDFGADYNHGGPLRWSPVVVEIFMVDWLGRKITEAPAFFERVADVLPSWVAYAGRRRGVPADSVDEAVAAVADYRGQMLDVVGDPEAWGPAKLFAEAARDAGVDLTDGDAVEEFIQRYNEGLSS